MPNEKEIFEKLSLEYGKDLLNAEKCKEIIKHLCERKSEIELELDITNEETSLGKLNKKSETLISTSNDTLKTANETLEEIEHDLNEVETVRNEVKRRFKELNTLQCTYQYLKIIQQVESLSSELNTEFAKNDDEKCVTLFANITEISRVLAGAPLTHLRVYLNDTIHYWHDILKNKLAKDFDEILKQVKWPFVSTNFTLVTPLPVNVDKLQIISEYLLQIEIPTETTSAAEIYGSDFPPLCLPIQFLVQPLRKRFIFHFCGTRQTNRPDKPEWYFTQVLTWIRDHRDFVGKYIQPVIDKIGFHHVDAKLELSRGLVQLAIEKLNNDLPALQFDDYTFSHSIDEALGFNKELRDIYSYPTNQPTVLAVLTQGQVFLKWIAMEKKYATEKMDAILSTDSVDAFDLITTDVEDLKVTTCAHSFITLLKTITERYECLPQPGHRLQFLDLQLELLDDFRVRLMQIVNAEEGDVIESKIPMIANTIFYVEIVLVDWSAMLHFLNLHYYKSQLEIDKQPPSSPTLSDFEEDQLLDFESDSVYYDTLSLYRHLRKDLLCMLAETVLNEVRKRSRHYRHENWSTIKVDKEFRSLSLIPSACPMFEVLVKRLHQLQKSLQSRLFLTVWRNIATQLDTFLFEDLVMDNRFSEGGALQLKFDITRNLLPLFSQFTEKPASYFSQVIEACNLLNITKGSALLLRETLLALEGATGVEDTRGRALKEVGVTNFTPKMSVRILNQRIDITVNRMEVD